jgi:hypothetical protein
MPAAPQEPEVATETVATPQTEDAPPSETLEPATPFAPEEPEEIAESNEVVAPEAPQEIVADTSEESVEDNVEDNPSFEKLVAPVVDVSLGVDELRTPKPHPSQRRAKREVAKKEPEEILTCQWPLISSRSMNEPELCGEPVEPGHRLCKKHLELIPRSRL